MVNCVSVSATTKHIEAPFNDTNIKLSNHCKFCCQDSFFTLGLKTQADFSIAHLSKARTYTGSKPGCKMVLVLKPNLELEFTIQGLTPCSLTPCSPCSLS